MTLRAALFILFSLVLQDLAVAATSSNPSTVRRPAGDWKSSGGTGIVCFQTPEQAKSYDKTVAQNVALSDEMVSQMTSLETLEHWERSNESFNNSLPADSLIKNLNQRLLIAAPLIAVQMDAVAQRIHRGSWQQTGLLEPTHDADPQRPFSELPAECRQIQLVVRVNRVVEAGEMPDIHVYFDSRLFEKLNPLNQAMLEIHERLYVLARQVGHADSFRTRLLVRTLFDENFWKTADVDARSMAMKLQSRFDYHFGNYIDIFYSFFRPENPKPFSPSARLQSLYEMVHLMKDSLHSCFEAKKVAPEECRQEIFAPAFLARLTDEQQFVFTYRWILTRTAPAALPNSEVTLIEWQDIEMKKKAALGMLGACVVIQQRVSLGVPFVAANRYCENRAKFFSPTPKGKDQN